MSARVKNYPALFTKSESSIWLVKSAQSSAADLTDAASKSLKPPRRRPSFGPSGEPPKALEAALLDPVRFRSARSIDSDVPDRFGLYPIRVRHIGTSCSGPSEGQSPDRVRGMITVTAAGVLATILPIGLLIIGFEIRQVPPLVATGRTGTVLLWAMGGIFCLGLTLGFWAEYRLIRAVVENVDIGPIGTGLVTIGLLCVGWSSFLLLSASLGVALGLTERIGRGARSRVEASPRRLARQIDYVEKHHPSVRSDSPE